MKRIRNKKDPYNNRSERGNQMIRNLIFALSAFVAISAGEIQKEAIPCDKGICMHWWPVLPTISGWHVDREASLHYGSNSLAPDSFTFNNAEVVMYARAEYKARTPDIKTLQDFVLGDKNMFTKQNPSIDVQKVDDIKTGDGQFFPSLTFFPKKEGNWERVAYGEETDTDGNEYFLIFTISSRTNKGYLNAEGSFKDLIGRYQKTPKFNSKDTIPKKKMKIGK